MLRLNSLFTDGCVLQADTEVPVWGTAQPRARGVVLVDDVPRATAYTDTDGHLTAKLPPQEAGGPHELTITVDGETVTVHDVYFGEVWLAAGQSNMAWELYHHPDAAQIIAQATDGQLRYFRRVPRERAAQSPQCESHGHWRHMTGSDLVDCPSTMYWFAHYLRAATGRTIGVLDASVGGCALEAWIPNTAYDTDPELPPARERWQSYMREVYPGLLERYRRNRQRGKAISPPKGPLCMKYPTGLFYGIMCPLAPYAMRGILWYQGEENAFARAVTKARLGYWEEYAPLLRAAFRSWRELWDRPDLPIIVVQLPNFRAPQMFDLQSAWALIREQQRSVVSSDRYTEMIVTIDIGDAVLLHPTDRRPFGQRLAAVAAGVTGWQPRVTFTQPVNVRADTGGIIVEFAPDVRLTTSDRQPVSGFAMVDGAGACHVPAPATIVSPSRVHVEVSGLQKPLMVYYAWADNPCANLTAESPSGPVSPFRSSLME